MYKFYSVKGRSNIYLFISMLLLPQLIGYANVLITGKDTQIYQALNKPSFAPPSSLFGPVWIFLYLLMGYSSYRIALFYKTDKKARRAYTLYLLQLLLNFFWPILFFQFLLFEIALINIILLAVLIFICVVLFHKLDSLAGVCMVPYLLWVMFATLINYFIVILN